MLLIVINWNIWFNVIILLICLLVCFCVFFVFIFLDKLSCFVVFVVILSGNFILKLSDLIFLFVDDEDLVGLVILIFRLVFSLLSVFFYFIGCLMVGLFCCNNGKYFLNNVVFIFCRVILLFVNLGCVVSCFCIVMLYWMINWCIVEGLIDLVINDYLLLLSCWFFFVNLLSL